MTRSKLSSVCLIAAVIAGSVVALHASDPVGVYAIVERVEPGVGPTAGSIQIFGVFSTAVRRAPDGSQPWPPGSFGTANTGDVYAAVQKGYLHVTCPPGKEATCTAEWADLKAVAGKMEVIGFGSRWMAAQPRVRAATEAPAAPDVYTLNVGVVKMGMHGGTNMVNRSQYPDLIAALQAAARSKSK